MRVCSSLKSQLIKFLIYFWTKFGFKYVWLIGFNANRKMIYVCVMCIHLVDLSVPLHCITITHDKNDRDTCQFTIED